jgi:hypothetical protein
MLGGCLQLCHQRCITVVLPHRIRQTFHSERLEVLFHHWCGITVQGSRVFPKMLPASEGFNRATGLEEDKGETWRSEVSVSGQTSRVGSLGKVGTAGARLQHAVAASQARYHFVMLQSSRCWDVACCIRPQALSWGEDCG